MVNKKSTLTNSVIKEIMKESSASEMKSMEIPISNLIDKNN